MTETVNAADELPKSDPTVERGRPIADRVGDSEILENFQRFRQRDDMFSRSHWDPGIRSEKTRAFFTAYGEPSKKWRDIDGFRQKDYALRNASWRVTRAFAGMKEAEGRNEGYTDEYAAIETGSELRMTVTSPEQMSADVKRAATLLGADLVGVARFDERWVYTHKFNRRANTEQFIELPPGLDSVIVVAREMKYDLITTAPSALGGTATGLGYSNVTTVLLSLAQFIRNLGYRAVACMNDTALSIPLAVQAGLGEYGRLGILITREFGPRVRLGKVFTDLPLTPDQPIRFGVREFCEVCLRCARECPPKAIPDAAPTDTVHNRSNIRGVRKWTINAEKCFGFWASQSSDCSICIRVCPYNKDYSRWMHRIARRLAATPLRGLILRLDGGYGLRKASRWWWNGRTIPGPLVGKE